MPLPMNVVDQIVGRLIVRYGSEWFRMWEGVDIDHVKADWADVLHGVSQAGILHALRHLPPDRPPKVDQFRALCIGVPQPGVKLLAPPKASQEVVARALRKARAITGRRPDTAWIGDLLERQKAGQRLSPAERAALLSVAKQGLL